MVAEHRHEPPLAAHDLEKDARAGIADLPVAIGNDGGRVRVSLFLKP